MTGLRCPLVKYLKDLVVTINGNFSSFLRNMAMSHWCMALVYDVSYIINAHINACIKAFSMDAL